jgi:hypothetical protein
LSSDYKSNCRLTLAGITLEVLLDDKQNLPSHIKKGQNRFGRGRGRKRHEKTVIVNSTGGVESSCPNRQREQPPPTATAPTASKTADMSSQAAVPGDEFAKKESRDCPEELMSLALLVGDKPCELVSFELPEETLDRLCDMYLLMQLRMPRRSRLLLSIGGIINLGVSVVLFDYDSYREESLIVRQLRTLTTDQETNKPGFTRNQI